MDNHLYEGLQKLANEHPEFRKDLVPLLRDASAQKTAKYNALSFQPWLSDERAVRWTLKYVTNTTEWSTFFYVGFKFALRDMDLATRFRRFAKMAGVEITERDPTAHPSMTFYNPQLYAQQKMRMGVGNRVMMAVAIAVLVKLQERVLAVKVANYFKDLIGDNESDFVDIPKMTPTQEFLAGITPDIQAKARQVWAELKQDKQFALNYCQELAQDINWHSLSIPGGTFDGIPEIPTDYSDIAMEFKWDLVASGYFMYALLTLAGATAAAKFVMRQSLSELG